MNQLSIISDEIYQINGKLLVSRIIVNFNGPCCVWQEVLAGHLVKSITIVIQWHFIS